MELWQHAWNGRIDAVRRYIAMGVDVNWKNPHSVSESARHTRERTVKGSHHVLACPLPAQFGYTALIMAVQKGHLEVVKLLLASGAHINLADDEVCAPSRAICAAHPSLTIGRACRAQTGATPLNWGAYQAHVDIVRFLLQSGADKNIACVKESWAGFKPIDVACFQDPDHANYGAITALLR